MVLHKNRRICGVLKNHLTHKCIDFVMESLKIAAEIRIMMSDPLGWHQYCFTPLAVAIVDIPKALMYAGISPRASSVTMDAYKQFGDAFQHTPRMVSITLVQLMEIEATDI